MNEQSSIESTFRKPRLALLAPPSQSSTTASARQARWWRESVVKMSRAQLASLTGYSVASIKRYEDGARRSISTADWQKYRMACAAVDAGWTTWEWQDAPVVTMDEINAALSATDGD